MKAVRIVETGKPLAEQDVPEPQVGNGEVLVRVRAAGICRSDVHYRAGTSSVGRMPITPGHEIAGTVEAVGKGVNGLKPGDRVCLHYLVTCGACEYCSRGSEQFCTGGAMIGKHIDGGYAEFIAVPVRNALLLPEEIPFEQGAILGCSSATCLHAFRKGRLQPGETVAVFGMGGLGVSAVQLARAFGALDVYAVDINRKKLELARSLGAVAVDATGADPAEEIRRLTGGRGVDVAVEVIGLPQTLRQAVQSLGVFGRAVVAGITDQPFEVDSYPQLLCKEAEIIGSADHLRSEMPLLIEFVRRGVLDLSGVITRTVPLDAGAVNREMDALEAFGGDLRSVITPG
jgi:2-desacetyl-2-hydroxyethyl bacteriochlorophyllide A dehydrogenase